MRQDSEVEESTELVVRHNDWVAAQHIPSGDEEDDEEEKR